MYLDTARLGRMSLGAQQAHCDFTRWAGEEAGSLYFDDFLRHGLSALPRELQRRYPGLAGWQGISDLKRRLPTLAGGSTSTRVLLANRSARLMMLAARLLCRRCRHLLVTDLSWPAYGELLKREAQRTGVRVTQVPLRHRILAGRVTVEAVIADVVHRYRRQGCDGLFLPAVDNFGIRFPVADIAQKIRQQTELRYFVVDAAQAFCHVPIADALHTCDLLIAGCHKWLRACHPMGIGFAGRPETQPLVEAMLWRPGTAEIVDDPLLDLTEGWETGTASPFGETVNLAPLFSCRGAIEDAMTVTQRAETALPMRVANAERLAAIARQAGYLVWQPQPGFRSGITVLQSRQAIVRQMTPEAIRRRFLEQGLSVTAYRGGRVRMSLPERPWQAGELETIQAALGTMAPATSRKVREVA